VGIADAANYEVVAGLSGGGIGGAAREIFDLRDGMLVRVTNPDASDYLGPVQWELSGGFWGIAACLLIGAAATSGVNRSEGRRSSAARLLRRVSIQKLFRYCRRPALQIRKIPRFYLLLSKSYYENAGF